MRVYPDRARRAWESHQSPSSDVAGAKLTCAPTSVKTGGACSAAYGAPARAGPLGMLLSRSYLGGGQGLRCSRHPVALDDLRPAAEVLGPADARLQSGAATRGHHHAGDTEAA